MKKPDTFLFVRSSRRHTEFPFPPERYLPGKNTARNHELPSFADEREQFLYGVDLFNHHYWWEAHEVWEGQWLRKHKSSPEAILLQGLIQVAAGRLKLELGQNAPAKRLHKSAMDRLQKTLGESVCGCWI